MQREIINLLSFYFKKYADIRNKIFSHTSISQRKMVKITVTQNNFYQFALLDAVYLKM
jgi:hypothetical protein